jgi:hypothetical protein
VGFSPRLLSYKVGGRMKKKRIRLISFLICVLFIGCYSTSKVHSTTQPPGVHFTIQPSSNEIVLPEDGVAEGRLDIQIQPVGMATNEQRKPIELIFVHDTSGSMAYKFHGVRKDKSAKYALAEALEYFEKNRIEDDQFWFVPFNSEITNNKSVKIRPNPNTKDHPNDLHLISLVLKHLDDVSYGGTNYSLALHTALNLFEPYSEKSKYIIFLTDGEPTTLYREEEVSYEKRIGYGNNKRYEWVTETTIVEYYLYADNTASRWDPIRGWKWLDFNEAKQIIEQEAKNTAKKLAQHNVTMYSIAFAEEGDVNYQLLEEMSNETGGYAISANPESLSSLFKEISNQFDSPSISGEVTIPLAELQHQGASLKEVNGAYIDERGVVHVPFTFNFPVNGSPLPSLKQISLPLQFTQVGDFTFEGIHLVYTDLEGKRVVVDHPPVTISVKKEVAPTFHSFVEVRKNSSYAPDQLIKFGTSHSDTNSFKIRYTLEPEGVISKRMTGELTNIQIVQPLPQGMVLKEDKLIVLKGNEILHQAEVVLSENNVEKQLVITIPHPITYENGAFSVDELVFEVVLHVDYAMSYVTLPRATLTYHDSRFGYSSLHLNTTNQQISMKIRLDEFASSVFYVGDHLGNVRKVDGLEGLILAEGKRVTKPVKGLKFSQGGVGLEVIYFDDSVDQWRFVHDFDIFDSSTSEPINENGWVDGNAYFKLTEEVAGDDTSYMFRIIADNGLIDWTELQPEDIISIPKSFYGTIQVSVKASSGFVLGGEKTVTKTIRKSKIQSIEVQPNPIELDVGTSVELHIQTSPYEAKWNDLNIHVVNSDIAIYQNENGRIVGLSEGETKLIVSSKEREDIQIMVPIYVKDPIIPLESVQFKKGKYTLKKGNKMNLTGELKWSPSNSTNKQITNVITSPAIINVYQDGEHWFVEGVDIGYATVTVETKEGLQASALFEVIPHDSSGGNDSSTEGKW